MTLNAVTVDQLKHIYASARYDPRPDLILTVGHLTPEQELSWGQVLEFVLRQHLRTFDWLHSENVAIVMGLVRDPVQEHGNQLGLEVHDPDDQPQLTIGFTDRTWLTLSRWVAFYHVRTGEQIRHLGSLRPLELTTVDLTTLWLRHLEKIKDGRQEAAKD